MMKKIKKIFSKEGNSLIELVVSMLISSIMLMMVVASVGPVAKLTLRLQQLQLAQEILQNTAVELQTQMADAIKYVKIYENGTDTGIVGEDGQGKIGVERGTALEYLNTKGYVELLTTDGCQETIIKRGETVTGSASAHEKGRLLNRYYFQQTGEQSYDFMNENGKLIARAVSTIFTEKYYMDYYLKVTYSYPKDGAGNVLSNGSDLNYIQAEITLYSDATMTNEHLVAKDNVVLDFRYQINRQDAVTGRKEVTAP